MVGRCLTGNYRASLVLVPVYVLRCLPADGMDAIVGAVAVEQTGMVNWGPVGLHW